MHGSKDKSPTPTDLIDWMNDEGLLDLDWDFPNNGDLFEAGLDDTVTVELAAAIEEHFGVEFTAEEFKKGKINTPEKLSKSIAAKMG